MGTDPKVPTTLPPEVLDKILEQIPVSGKGRRTLISCALVATWWTGPSQRCLFSSIEIDRRNYGRWMDGVVLSGSKAHLLEHVRSLQHGRTSSLGIKYRMRDLAQNAGGYLSDLRNIHTLALSHITVEHIGEGEFHTCFSAFRETLTHISFDSFTTSFSAFITLVGYFPNVTTLHLRSFILKPDDGPVPPLSRPLQGKLHLYDVSPGNLMFFSRFAKLDLEYEELSIHILPTLTGNGLVECALRIAPSTVKFLRLGPGLNFHATPTIRDFRQLRELELVVSWPSPTHRTILSSISSAKLRKVVFLVRPVNYFGTFVHQITAWTPIDKELCGVVDRLGVVGYRHTLEAELRVYKVEGDQGEYDFTKLLPEFSEKGVVTIVDAT